MKILTVAFMLLFNYLNTLPKLYKPLCVYQIMVIMIAPAIKLIIYNYMLCIAAAIVGTTRVSNCLCDDCVYVIISFSST